jgi:hypothetical protein
MRDNPRRGAASILEILIVSGLLLFFILAPVAYYNLTVTNMAAASVFNTTLQSVSICGGYDARVEEQLYTNLMARGLIDADGRADVEAVISADKATPTDQRQVLVECSSDQLNGDAPIYRAYAMGADSGIALRVSVRQTGVQNFLTAISQLTGFRRNSQDGYFVLSGYVMSQLPMPV